MELLQQIKLLNGVPTDARLYVADLVSDSVIKNKTLYLGFGEIYSKADAATFYVSGGNSTDGWEFTSSESHEAIGENISADSILNEEEISVSGIEEQGNYSDGDVIPVGETSTNILTNMLQKYVVPTYEYPTAEFSCSKDNIAIPAGNTAQVTFGIDAVINDAGDFTTVKIFQDDVIIHESEEAGGDFTFSKTLNLSVSEGDVETRIEVHYTQGPIKQDSYGEDYSTGRIPAGTLYSKTYKTTVRNKVFYGSTDIQSFVDGQDVTDFSKTLKSSILDTVTDTMTTKMYSILAPKEVDLLSAVNLDGSLEDLTENFIETTLDVVVVNSLGETVEYYLRTIVNEESYNDDYIKIDFNYGSTSMILEVATDDENREVVLPFSTSVENATDVEVDWGDGTVDTTFSNDLPTHTYDSSGTFTVKISGTVREFSCLNSGIESSDTDRFISLIDAGTLGHTNIHGMFYQCVNLVYANVSGIFTPKITGDTLSIFSGCSNLTTVEGIPQNDFSSITSLGYLFYTCSKLNLDISEVYLTNGNNIITLSSAFNGCSSIYNTPKKLISSVPNCYVYSNCFANSGISGELPDYLFAYSQKTLQLPSVFLNCTQLTGEIPENIFKDSTITGTSIFSGCSGFTGMLRVNLLKNILSPRYMFYKCAGLELLDPEFSNVPMKFYDITALFSGCSKMVIDADLSLWEIEYSFYSQVFLGCKKARRIIVENWPYSDNGWLQTFYGCNDLETVGDLSYKIYGSNQQVNGVFKQCYKITSIPGIDTWDLGGRTSTKIVNYIFEDCTKLTTVAPDWWNRGWEMPGETSSVFKNCVSMPNYKIIPTDWGGLGLDIMQITIEIIEADTYFELYATLWEDTVEITWGDATGDEEFTYDGTRPSHTYANPGTYTIIIDGSIEQLSVNDNNKNLLKGIDNIGADNHLTSMNFSRSSIQYFTRIGGPDCLKNCSMGACFHITSSFTSFCYEEFFSYEYLKTNFDSVFYNTGLNMDITNLEFNAPNLVTMINPFLNSYDITGELSDKFLSKSTELQNIQGLLKGTIIKVNLHEDFFINNTKLTRLASSFGTCTIIGLSNKLLQYSPSIYSVHSMFSKCTVDSEETLTVTDELLSYNTAEITEIYSMFEYSELNVNITGEFFKMCGTVISASTIFRQTKGSVVLTSDVFKNLVSCESLYAFAYNCKNISFLITEESFKYNTYLNTIGSFGFDSSMIANLTESTFRYNTELVNVSSSFVRCTVYMSDEDIFKYNTKITNLINFCYSVQNGTLLINESLGENIENLESALGAFYDVTNNVGYGTAPEWWLQFPDCDGTDCFRGQDNLDNYPCIPTEWGGLGETCGNTMEITIETTSSNTTYNLPVESYEDTLDISWGDGNTDSLLTHTYAEAGVYTISIVGFVTGIDATDDENIVGVDSTGGNSFLKFVFEDSSIQYVRGEINENTFRNCAFDDMFHGCFDLEEVIDVFEYEVLTTTMDGTFEYVPARPEIIKIKAPNCTEMTSTFKDSRINIEIDADFFSDIPNLVNITEVFDGSYVTGYIDENIFLNNPNIEIMDSAFKGTEIYYVSNDFLKSTPKAHNLDSLFSGATDIKNTVIDNTFFSHTGETLTDLSYMFYRCSADIVIDSEFFNRVDVDTDFNNMFTDCRGKVEVLENPFKNLGAVRTFTNVFRDVENLHCTISDTMFTPMVNLVNIGGLFEGSTVTITLTENTFKTNVLLDDIDQLFKSCLRVRSDDSIIPTPTIEGDPFKYNTAITYAPEVFFDSLAGVTINNTILTSLDTTVVGLDNAFQNDGAGSALGEAPALWDLYNSYAGGDCFAGNTELDNYPCIPTDWGGLGGLCPADETSLILEVVIPSDNYELVIPISGDVDNYIDWGDGDYVINTTENPSYTFTNAGTYTLRIDDGYNIFNSDESVSMQEVLTKIIGFGVASVSYIRFYGCSNLTSIEGKFPSVTTLGVNFYNCKSLKIIPEGLFENCVNVVSVNNCFHYCSFTHIPSDLFSNLHKLTNVDFCFRGCTYLEVIPDGLFDSCTEITSLTLTFGTCTSLTYIPEDLFKFNTKLTSASYCFSHSSSIIEIPENLFRYNTLVTEFIYTFGNMGGFTEIPENIFKYNTLATDFSDVFLRSALVNIPLNIFKYNTLATNFSRSFRESKSLKSLPSGLFNSCPNVTDFLETFNRCTVLEGVIDGAEYWELFTEADGTDCFLGSTQIDNYACIPSDWGGLGEDCNVGMGLEIVVPSDGYTLTLPISGNVSNKISWLGDGNYTSNTEENPTYTYATAGTYTLKVGDGYDSFDANTSYTMKEVLTKVLKFGEADLNSISFRSSTNLTDVNGTMPNVNVVSYGFAYCSSLSSIPTGLFDNCVNVTSFSYCFYGCTKLVNIPIGLFDSCSKVTSFYYCFRSCLSLTTIPTGLFDKCSNVTNFSYCFYSCTSLITIPTGLFDSNTEVTSFYYCFRSCLSITTITTGLFDSCSKVTDFGFCFQSCSSLTTIPTELFDNNTNVTTFNDCFNSCISLTTIPIGLFDSCSKVTTFSYCFQSCTSLTSIPSGLFDSCTEVTNFTSCFRSCSSLTTIPTGLFDNCPNVTSFSYCFQSCTSLTSIPSGLFDSCTNVIYFHFCFRNCTSLTSIPTGLFDNNTEVTTFYYCFCDCSRVAEIPTGLFDNNTKVTNFSYCFYYCPQLQQIPTGLFDNCVNVTTFSRCFFNCASLTTIPIGLFVKCPLVTEFRLCFYACTSLTGFIDGAEYWELFPDADGTNCFNGDVLLDNYACIPVEWGGLGEDCSEPESFMTLNLSVSTAGSTVTIPVHGFETVSISIDEGDWHEYSTDYPVIEIPTTGLTKIDIGAGFANLDGSSSTFKAALQTVSGFSDENEGSITFNGCYNLTSVEGTMPILTGRSYREMFRDCTNLSYVSSTVFANGSNIVDFTGVFRGCTSLTAADPGWFSNATSATTFYVLFYLCTGITTVPDDIFVNCTEVTTYRSVFNASGITYAQKELFENSTKVTTFMGAFSSCANLATVESGIFDSHSVIDSVEGCFRECPSLRSVPLNLFYSSTTLTSVRSLFYQSGLVAFPSTLFSVEKNPNLTNFYYTFYQLSGMTGSADELWNMYPDAVSTAGCFLKSSSLDNYGCIPVEWGGLGEDCYAGLKLEVVIPTDNYTLVLPISKNVDNNIDWGDGNVVDSLDDDPSNTYATAGTYTIKVSDGYEIFDAHDSSTFKAVLTKILSFGEMQLRSMNFRLCTNLSEIKGVMPTSSDLSYCFSGCSSLTSIPENIFDDNAWNQLYSYCFYDCPNLQSIPAGLFSNCTRATHFNGCFTSCTSLTEIPTGLFDNCTAVSYFNRCFYNCYNIQSIPAGLFDNSGYVTYFDLCFYNCNLITTIPTGLFDNNSSVLDFSGCFKLCTSLTTIPSGLFDNCPDVTTFWYCFYECVGLKSIPSGLFNNNTLIISLKECFYGCTSLENIPAGLFDGSTIINTFSGCFENCTSLSSIPVGLFNNCTNLGSLSDCFRACSGLTGSISSADYWELFPDVNGFYCFYECVNLDNYACIPSEWGGLGEDCTEGFTEDDFPADHPVFVYDISESGTKVSPGEGLMATPWTSIVHYQNYPDLSGNYYSHVYGDYWSPAIEETYEPGIRYCMFENLETLVLADFAGCSSIEATLIDVFHIDAFSHTTYDFTTCTRLPAEKQITNK